MYCYYAEDTVERNILDLAARQGLSLYTKDNSAGTLTATTVPVPGKKSIDAPSKKAQKGDFVFKCVFPAVSYICQVTHHSSQNGRHACDLLPSPVRRDRISHSARSSYRLTASRFASARSRYRAYGRMVTERCLAGQCRSWAVSTGIIGCIEAAGREQLVMHTYTS